MKYHHCKQCTMSYDVHDDDRAGVEKLVCPECGLRFRSFKKGYGAIGERVHVYITPEEHERKQQ